MVKDEKAAERAARLIKERPDLFDDEDCRPPRAIEEIGISVPNYLRTLSEKADTDQEKPDH